MNLHTDVPTHAQVSRLLEERTASVSLYLPCNPVSNGDAERIALGNLAAEALRQLEAAGTERVDLLGVEEQLADLADDTAFWRLQARSLAVFRPEAGDVRLPNTLVELVEVSDRFHAKPLLRAVTFPRSRSCWRWRRDRRACWRSLPALSRRRWPSPTCRATSPARSGSPRSPIGPERAPAGLRGPEGAHPAVRQARRPGAAPCARRARRAARARCDGADRLDLPLRLDLPGLARRPSRATRRR